MLCSEDDKVLVLCRTEFRPHRVRKRELVWSTMILRVTLNFFGAALHCIALVAITGLQKYKYGVRDRWDKLYSSMFIQ